MRLSTTLSALALPVDRLSPGQRRLFTLGSVLALLIILACAAWVRFTAPQWPTSDPDTWGYLHPAITEFQGRGFIHTYGRNFLYPGWVYLLLATFKDFRAITVAQHLLGLGAGALLWTAWRQWRGWFTTSRLPALVDAFLGLGLTLFFLRSPSATHFELQIRPEAIFPFFAVLGVCLLLAFLRVWFVVRHPVGAAILGGLCVFNTALLYQLKPSFGLAVGFSLLPLMWAAWQVWTRDPLPRRLLAASTITAAVLAALLFILPERQFAKADWFNTVFLPETLLTVHADMVRDQMVRDAREHVKTPFSPDFVAAAAAEMDQETNRASAPDQAASYPSLGYNPDFLMYRQDSFCRWLYEHSTPDQAAAVCLYFYKRAALHYPGRMTAKVFRQLRIFYSVHCLAFWPAQKFKEEQLYRKTNTALAHPNYQEQLREYPPGVAYLDAAARLQASKADHRTPPWVVRLNLAAAVIYLPLLLLFLAGMGFVARWPAERRAGLWQAGWLVVMVHGLNFGNCLTISIVHSLDVDRYSYNLFVYAAWCELAALVWLYEMATAWWTARSVGTSIPATEPKPVLVPLKPA